MHYEINVAKFSERQQKYLHFFATHERSITTASKLVKVYYELKAVFPAPEYELLVTKYTTSGQKVDMMEE